MADPPLVTVVIPTWNRLPLLREAVDSVRAQTYPRWEIVVADDGSTDGTAGWVRGLNDPRIVLAAAEHGGHVGRVRNRGAACGSGSLFAFLDSDDVWLPGKLEAQVAALRAGGAGWSFTAYELMDAAGRIIPFIAGDGGVRSGDLARDVLTARVGVDVSTLMVERALFGRLRGFSEDARLTFRGDHEMVLRLALASPAAAVDAVLTRVREHPGRITRTQGDAYLRSARVYELFLEQSPPPPLAALARRMQARHLRGAARECLARRDLAGAARLAARVAGVFLRPRRVAARTAEG